MASEEKNSTLNSENLIDENKMGCALKLDKIRRIEDFSLLQQCTELRRAG